MRKKIIAANWKMNLQLSQATELLDQLGNGIKEVKDNTEIIIAPPFVYLMMAKASLAHNNHIYVAAQNCYTQSSGAYTGEISAEMLSSIGVKYVILGHSERREYFSETNVMLRHKIQMALSKKIKVIFCCGESLATREQNQYTQCIQKQIEESLFGFSEEDLTNITIAYEPIWAIGTGKTATSAQAQEVHLMIRNFLKTKYACADSISILYGGSVKSSNAKELFNCSDIDGALVGGASLVATEFIDIIHAI